MRSIGLYERMLLMRSIGKLTSVSGPHLSMTVICIIKLYNGFDGKLSFEEAENRFSKTDCYITPAGEFVF